ncbi:MAG TPA: phosphoribosylformylglycinamidine synthase subunit PurQ [Caldisericia bacterium]|nr:phosphoribosylformylglycinamidine synthase subunit PurQ [Caldisericia bacterium]
MTFGVVVFPGSNCDRDAIYAVSGFLGQKVLSIWHQDTTLPRVDAVILPGGFSYGDYLRPGAIASRSPVMKAVKSYADKGGWVIGICNGFQVLVESALLPGILLRNKSTRFISTMQSLLIQNNQTPFTRNFSIGQSIKLPIAHKDGNYFADPILVEKLKKNKQIVVTYSENPNGSLEDIAGICNEQGNVFGMMPHPERACADWLGSSDGLGFFQSMLKTWEEQS